MREYAEDIVIKNAKQRKKTRVDLKKLSKLEMNMTDDPSSGKMEEYNNAKSELEKIYEYITDGIIMRSESQWYEEDEKSTKYFCLWRKGIKLNHTSGKCV